MGQEISQQKKYINIRQSQQNDNKINNKNKNSILFKNPNYLNSCEKYTKHKEPIYTSVPSILSNTSTGSIRESIYHSKLLNSATNNDNKKLIHHLSTTTVDVSSSNSILYSSKGNSDSQGSPTPSTYTYYEKLNDKKYLDSEKSQPLHNHQSNSSQSTDSGIYYTSCHCSSTISSSLSSSAASTYSGVTHSAISIKSAKSSNSLDKQKQYLNNHLYIKSYLDILEEDEKARAKYKPARPGGIRNYTPKILAGTPLSTSAPSTIVKSAGDFQKEAQKQEDPWI